MQESWDRAVQFLEALPDWMNPNIHLSFNRMSDFRRKETLKNKHSVINFITYISFQEAKIYETGYRNQSPWTWVKGFGNTPEIAIDNAMRKAREKLDK